ncbi:MAG: hypothetical protein NTW49_08835 [Bacteroidia bacterium]|nr:hypothetical protein [Bacteroidia bacterium]
MTSPKLKTILEELKAPALIIAGIIGGNFAGKLIDKVVPVDETVTGFQFKSLVKPAVLLAAGAGATILVKDKNIKMVATGVAISGVASGVRVILKKELLSGLGNTNRGIGTDNREPLTLSIEKYRPDLPQLPENSASQPEQPSVEGIAGNDDFQDAEIL